MFVPAAADAVGLVQKEVPVTQGGFGIAPLTRWTVSFIASATSPRVRIQTLVNERLCFDALSDGERPVDFSQLMRC